MNVPAQALLDIYTCLTATLQDNDAGVCESLIQVGSLPDGSHCGQCSNTTCGTAFVSYATASTDLVPQSAEAWTKCASGFYVSGVAGVLRCYPVDDGESARDPEEYTEAALAVVRDMLLVREALTCCYDGDLVLRNFVFFEPSGGCAGGQWEFDIPVGV